MASSRYFWRLSSAFFKKFKFLLLVGIIIGALGFIFISKAFPYLVTGNVERIGLTGRYRVDNLPPEILHLIGDGLTKLDAAGVPEPSLAESWEVSADGKTWTFHLKQGAHWQDGKKLSSYDLKYPFSDVTTETPDEQTMVFKLQNPFAPFPSVLSRPVFKKGLLGTGNWRVPSRGLRLTGNFVESITLVDKNKNREVFKFYPTEERTKLAFKLGSVDKIEKVFSAKPFDTWGNVEVSENINTNEYVAVFFNTQDKTLSEKSLRQALAYGIDKSKFEEPRAISPISPNSWAFNPQVKPYLFDLARAKELLKDLPKEQRSSLSLKLVTTATLLGPAEAIASNWKELGVQTEVQVTSSIPEDFQSLLVIFDIPTDPDQYSVWHSTQTASNITKFSNPRVDKLLEDGRTEADLGKRKNIYLDFQRFLVEESPAAFLYHPITYTVSRK